MKQIWIVSLCVLLVFPIVQVTPFSRTQMNEEVNLSRIALLNGGWLEKRDNISILHVSGSHYEMGYQHGYLLRNEVQQNIRAFLKYAEQHLTLNDLLTLWNISKSYIQSEYIQEIQGIADGANVSFFDIVASIMAVEYSDQGCYGIAAWGPATLNERLYHARSFDLPSDIQDPLSGKYARENTVLIVRNPDNGSASLCPSIAGSFHTGGGINEYGVALGIQICWSKDQIFHGNPYHFRVQAVLDTATTAAEALQILNENRTHGFNFIVSQANPAAGFILEQTANLTYIGTYDDSIENIKPFWSIDHVVRRTNVFIEPTIAETQRKRYDPTGFIGFLNLLLFQKKCPFFAVYQLYKSVSEKIYDHWGNLDLHKTMGALQEGYRAEDFFLLRLIQYLGKGTGMAEAWNQWVVCGVTGDILVSFASHDKIAFETEPHYFNFYDLLNADPP